MSIRNRVYRTEAIVLRRINFGEADRIITVITPARGKLRLVAKGVRRPKSRKSGHLELFMRVELMLAKGRDLDVVTQAEASGYFPRLATDLFRYGCASYAVELIDRFAVEEHGTASFYRLLNETLERLCSDIEPALILRYYELKLLEVAGFRPELFKCVGCGQQIQPQDQFFSFEDGGVLCPPCGSVQRGGLAIHLPALKVLRHFQRSSYEQITELQLRAATSTEVERILYAYLNNILERQLKTPGFLQQIKAILDQSAESV